MRNRVAEHVAALPKSGIRKFFDIVAQSKDIVSLGVGEPDFDTPWHISRAAVTCLENGGTHYTSNLGTPELRQAICRYLERRFCAKFDWKCEVLATVGVSEAIDLAIRAICSPGDEVLYHEPCFVSYAPTIRLAHAVPVCVETRVEDEFRLTVDELEKKVTPKTKAVLLNFPCNPTGATLSRDDMAAILDFCERHDIILLADEVYSELNYEIEGENRRHVVTRKRRASRVAGEVKEHRLRLRRDLLLKRVDCKAELVLHTRLDADGNGMGEADRRRIRHEARFVVEHFVARRANGAYREVYRLGNAHRRKHLALPVELRAEAAVEIAAYRLPQLGRSEI